MSALDNKQLVLAWWEAGQTSEAGRAMLTDDFTWHVGRSTAPIITGGPAVLRGEDALRMMDGLQYALYAGGETVFDRTFIIAEDEWVAVQANISARSFEGEPYDNTYVFTFRCRNGKIAEFWASSVPPARTGPGPTFALYGCQCGLPR